MTRFTLSLAAILTLIALGASVAQASPDRQATAATPASDSGPYCVAMGIVQTPTAAQAALDAEYERKTGKPLTRAALGEATCFDTVDQLREYERDNGIQLNSQPQSSMPSLTLASYR